MKKIDAPNVIQISSWPTQKVDSQAWKKTTSQQTRQWKQLEKDIADFLKHNKQLCLVEEVSIIRKELDSQRLEFSKSERATYNQAIDVKKDVTIFKAKFASEKLGKKNLQEVDKMVHAIEKKIQWAKQERADEAKELAAQRRDIERELAQLCGGIPDYNDEAYNKETKGKREMTNAPKKRANVSEDESSVEKTGATESDAEKLMRHIKREIEEIDATVEKKGGRNCGWIPEDHDDFVKLLNKNGKNPRSIAFKAVLHRNFPIFSDDEITQHIDLFCAQQELNEQKKRLVERYKLLQKKTAESELAQLKKAEQDENSNLENQKTKEQREKERQRRKEQLEKWQREKEREAAELRKKEQEDKLRRAVSMDEERQREVKEKLAKQEALRRYKEKKEMEMKLLSEQQKLKEKMSKPILFLDDLRRIKEKEERLVRRRSELKDRKKQFMEERNQRLNEVFNKFDQKFQYVQNNLLQQTTAVVKKQTRKFNPEKDAPVWGNNYGGVLIRTEGRKLVQWRQNI
jgi:hypothetical protein